MTGPVFQYAYFVDDLEAGATAWARTVGAGPFVVAPQHRAQRFGYRGTNVEADEGFELACELWANDIVACCFDTRTATGAMTELHIRTPRIDATFERWQEAHRQWDDQNLLRGHVSGT